MGWAARLVLPVALSLVIGGLGVWGGYQWADKRATVAAAEVAATHAAALERANAENRRTEKEHETRVRNLQAEFAAREAEARERDAAVIDDLRDGTRRLRLQVSNCDRARLPEAGPSASRADGGGRAELAPETSAALWRIAADGDAAARRLIALQEWAQSAVRSCNGRPGEIQ